jgi:hypothetical protein
MQIEFDSASIIPDDQLVDIVTTGLEGGYSWFVIDGYHWSTGDGIEKPWAVVSEGCECWEGSACEQLTAAEPDEDHADLIREFPLNIATLRVGLEKYIQADVDRGWSLPKILGILGDMDLNDADAILQYTVFGEVRYG